MIDKQSEAQTMMFEQLRKETIRKNLPRRQLAIAAHFGSEVGRSLFLNGKWKEPKQEQTSIVQWLLASPSKERIWVRIAMPLLSKLLLQLPSSELKRKTIEASIWAIEVFRQENPFAAKKLTERKNLLFKETNGCQTKSEVTFLFGEQASSLETQAKTLTLVNLICMLPFITDSVSANFFVETMIQEWLSINEDQLEKSQQELLGIAIQVISEEMVDWSLNQSDPLSLHKGKLEQALQEELKRV